MIYAQFGGGDWCGSETVDLAVALAVAVAEEPQRPFCTVARNLRKVKVAYLSFLDKKIKRNNFHHDKPFIRGDIRIRH